MDLTKKLTPRPSNLLGAGLSMGISVAMTMIARRNNPTPASGMDTAIRAAKWGACGYVIGSFVDMKKITRLGDDIEALPPAKEPVTLSGLGKKNAGKKRRRSTGKKRQIKK